METDPTPPTAPARRPSLARNWISLAGATLAVVSLANILVLIVLEALSTRENPYLGILTWVVFPIVLLAGLGVVPIGMLLERRRRQKELHGRIPFFPPLDLNVPRQRHLFGGFLIASFLFLLMSFVGAYQAYEFSDSVSFCGQTCHSVMQPEYVAYQASAHARVECVACHVGPGATWFVRSKLSGAYQVYAVLADAYPRPIRSPIKSLRPARETCEQCHWPEKFWGAQLKVVTHFLSDEANTPMQVRMLVKTGGGSPTRGLTAGIHWHMNIENQVWYVANDRQRQEIPWVRSKDPQGRVTDYLATGSSLTPEEIERAPKRRMDCMDCHNRPSHVFLPPERAVDNAILAGSIDRSLPSVKEQAVAVLSKAYPTTGAAREAIATTLDAFYYTKYPEVHAGRGDAIKEAIAEVQALYETNIFPEMKVDWRTHPDNIGHLYYPGCFRCHDGQHVSAEGKVIGNACDVCHTILSQEEGKTLPMAAGISEPFEHPVDVGDLSEGGCDACHTGGA